MRSLNAWLVFSGLALAQQPNLRDMLQKPIVYSVPGMDQAKVTKDIHYRTDGGPALVMDVYQPAHLNAEQRCPAVLFVHGGARIEGATMPAGMPLPKDWGVFQSYGRLMAASGLIGVTFNHRIADPEDGFRKGISDVEAAIDYVRSHATGLHVDRDRLALMVFSAGGPLLSAAMKDPQPYIRCLVSFYAVLDVRSANLKEESPLHFLSLNAAQLPPILIARAGNDSAALNATIDQFVQQALAKDIEIELMNLKGAPHGFDILFDTPRSREAIARAVEFLKTHLNP